MHESGQLQIIVAPKDFLRLARPEQVDDPLTITQGRTQVSEKARKLVVLGRPA